MSEQATEGGDDTQPETLLEFPCEIVVKAMGLNESDFEAHVRALVEPHVINADTLHFDCLQSSEGKYVSVRAHFTAAEHAELLRIYTDLRADERIKYLL